MDLERATEELYRVTPARFTSARDAMAAAARDVGQRELAASLKKLRKPSVGAWLANLLVSEQSSDVEHLVDLGAELRMPKRKVEGDQIRRVSKEKGDVVSKLVRDATSKASREGQSVSASAMLELEATLDAAFADPQAAEMLLQGHLSSGLHYSGLGFAEQAVSGIDQRCQEVCLPTTCHIGCQDRGTNARWRRRSKRRRRLMLSWRGRDRPSRRQPKNCPGSSRPKGMRFNALGKLTRECQRRSRSSPSSHRRARTRRMRRRRSRGFIPWRRSRRNCHSRRPIPCHAAGHTGQRERSAPDGSPNPLASPAQV